MVLLLEGVVYGEGKGKKWEPAKWSKGKRRKMERMGWKIGELVVRVGGKPKKK